MAECSCLSSLASDISMYFIGATTKEQALSFQRFMQKYLPNISYDHISRFNHYNHHLTHIIDGFFIPVLEGSVEYTLIEDHLGFIGSLGIDNDFMIQYDTKHYFEKLIDGLIEFANDQINT